MSIAIMCSGGDSCGMNPAIKSFVDYVYEKRLTPYFIYEGFEGLINNKIKKARHKDVAGIMHRGGTIIKTSRSNRFYKKEFRDIAYKNLQAHNIDKIVMLGGNGSFQGLNTFANEFNISFVAVPTTIDNDIYGSDYCLGVDTALNVITNALDDIRDTSSSFKRAFVVETMGRDCGYLAMVSAITSGAEICATPEVEINLKSLEKRLKHELNNGRDYILAISAEGSNRTEEIAKWLKEKVGIETRIIVLGHIQRGGNPTVFERLMANEFVTLAVDKLLEEKAKLAIVYKNSEFEFLDIKETVSKSQVINKKILKQLEKMIK